MKEQEPPNKELNEMEASNLSDIEFKKKKRFIRMLKKRRTTRNLERITIAEKITQKP